MPYAMKRVPNNVPSDCDMILIDERDASRKKRCLNNKEAYLFKWAVKSKCPCQQSERECPISATSGKFKTIHHWFDGHKKEVLGWPFTAVYYPCKQKCVCYRHYHRTYVARQNAIYNLKMKSEYLTPENGVN